MADGGYQPILVFDEEGRLVASLLRPAGRPSGKEAAGLIQRLIHSLRRHWPNTEFLLRADGHYSTPEVMDLCDTLGVDYVFGLPTNSRVRKHVETREADTVKHYKPKLSSWSLIPASIGWCFHAKSIC